MLNYSAPQSSTIYLHRVGRTARAGRAGRACTLAAESDRKVVKEVVRAARSQGAKIASRVVDAHLVDACMNRIDALESEIDTILRMEKEERALGEAERDVRKGENLVEFEAEIKSRPKRTWFATEREKEMAKEAGRKELNGRTDGMGSTQESQSSQKGKEGKGNGKGRLSNNQKKALDAKKEMRDGRVWKKGKGMGDPKSRAEAGTGKRTGIAKTKMKSKGKAKEKISGKSKPNPKARPQQPK